MEQDRKNQGGKRLQGGQSGSGRRNYFADLSDELEDRRPSREEDAPARRSASGGRRGGGWEERAPRNGGESLRPVLRLIFFPAQLVFLELVFHLYMDTPLSYSPIWTPFGLSAGLILSALTLPFPKAVNRVLMKALSILFPVIYVAEMVAKTILQSYYPLSFLGTAAGNKLTDYLDAIIPTVIKTLPIALVMLIPTILLFALGSRFMGYERYDVRLSGVALIGAVILHLVGLGTVHFPWKGDLTPAKLYDMDSNIDDQVEQLGLWNMLRLDVKHMIFPAKNHLDDDFTHLGPGPAQTPSPGPEGTPDPGVSPDPAVSETPEPTPVIDTSPNVMDVDLAALAESAKNKDIQWLANYFNSVTPTNKNQYTGMFEGYNVIFFTLEGFSGYAIDPELTPTLYKLTHEGFVFNNFYTALHFTSTSGGECQNLLGIYPKNGSPATLPHTGDLKTNLYFSLAQQLGREGYQVLGYHPNGNMYNREKSHPNLGYSWHQFGAAERNDLPRGSLHGFDGLDVNSNGKLSWPQKDSVMVEASVDDYIHSSQPFHVYYLTISGHMPYSDNRAVAPYRDTVRALPYSETTQNYVGTCMEVDKALEVLIQKLDEAGKLDKTLIVAVPDHIPYFNVDTLEELAGQKFGSSEDLQYLNEQNINFDVYKSSLIIWSASMTEPVEVDKVCCQVDILPTLSNLLGLEYDSRMLDGADILSDSEGLVIFTSRCWKSDRGFYNRFTQTFTPAPGVTMTAEEQEEYVSAMRKLVGYKLDSTNLLIENDFYDYVFG